VAALDNNSYSRAITLLKIVLPLAALAILSTLFLMARSVESTRTIPIARGEIETLAREERITSPSFSAVTDSGAAVSVSAQVAVPSDGGMSARGVQARIELADGENLAVEAADGRFDPARRLGTLSGGVSVVTSNGYTIRTESLLVDAQAMSMTTEGGVAARGPLGRMTAGKMVLRQQTGPDRAAGYELLFQDHVNLVYRIKQ